MVVIGSGQGIRNDELVSREDQVPILSSRLDTAGYLAGYNTGVRQHRERSISRAAETSPHLDRLRVA